MDKQTCKFLARVAENLPEMSGGEMQAWIDNPNGLQAFLRGLNREFDLLKFVGHASVKATNKFIAKDNLKQANVGFTGNNFDRFFLNKVENDIRAGKVVVHELKKASFDKPILDELGDRAEISMAHFFDLLERQKDGGAGVLLANGYVNIAHIRDAEGNPWAVDACWDSANRSWLVNAGSVEHPYGWSGGNRVLSRK